MTSNRMLYRSHFEYAKDFVMEKLIEIDPQNKVFDNFSGENTLKVVLTERVFAEFENYLRKEKKQSNFFKDKTDVLRFGKVISDQTEPFIKFLVDKCREKEPKDNNNVFSFSICSEKYPEGKYILWGRVEEKKLKCRGINIETKKEIEYANELFKDICSYDEIPYLEMSKKDIENILNIVDTCDNQEKVDFVSYIEVRSS